MLRLLASSCKMQGVLLSITQVYMHTIVLSCSYLVLYVRVGPSSKEKLYHLVVVMKAGCFQCCPTILYERMSESNHMGWLDDSSTPWYDTPYLTSCSPRIVATHSRATSEINAVLE